MCSKADYFPALLNEIIPLPLELPKLMDQELLKPGSGRGDKASQFVVPLILMFHGGGKMLEMGASEAEESSDVSKMFASEGESECRPCRTKGRTFSKTFALVC